MRKILFVFLLVLPNLAFAQTVMHKFAWTAPTTNEDGTELNDLAGYKVYQSKQSGVYGTRFAEISDPNATEYTIEDVPAGEVFYWTLTAFDTSGNESKKSNEVSTDTLAPGAPNISITININTN